MTSRHVGSSERDHFAKSRGPRSSFNQDHIPCTQGEKSSVAVSWSLRERAIRLLEAASREKNRIWLAAITVSWRYICFSDGGHQGRPFGAGRFSGMRVGGGGGSGRRGGGGEAGRTSRMLMLLRSAAL